MGKAELRKAADGHLARVAPHWSEEKLLILASYLSSFAKACRTASGWYALDLFAGGGLNVSLLSGMEIPGSPLIALEAGRSGGPMATKVVMAESHEAAFAALESRTHDYGDRAELVNSDCNTAIGEMLQHLPRKAPAFAFLDPEGSELDWKTVEAIADHKRGTGRFKIEQLILFSDAGVARLATAYPAYVSRVFGHERWKAIRDLRTAGRITPDEARTRYVELYGEGLRSLGYSVVLDRQFIKSGGQPMYFLLFASDHQVGMRVMENRFEKIRMSVREEMGQGNLFPAEQIPYRKRLGRQ